jgi:hypothetical protein
MVFDRTQLARRIVERLDACSVDELRVVDRVLDGIDTGRQLYGPLDISTRPRNWKRESAMEMRDYLFYCAAHLVAEDAYERELTAERFLGERERRDTEPIDAVFERELPTRTTTESMHTCICGHPQALHANELDRCLVSCDCEQYRGLH